MEIPGGINGTWEYQRKNGASRGVPEELSVRIRVMECNLDGVIPKTTKDQRPVPGDLWSNDFSSNNGSSSKNKPK